MSLPAVSNSNVSNPEVSFADLNLNSALMKAITDSGYTTPTPVQAQAIPAVLAGKDLMVSAQTGTGKTAAFMLPALHRLNEKPMIANCKGPRILVLVPTRELAQQVTDAVQRYGKHMRQLRVVSILGGVPYARQRSKMRDPIDVMLATPGRLIDYIGQGAMDFRRVEMIVLDEADRMLDMGFRDAVKEITDEIHTKHQTLLFSATIDESINHLARAMLHDPVRIEITPQHTKHADIEQRLHFVSDLTGKQNLLSHLLKQGEVGQAIIFTATKHAADCLARDLYNSGHDAAALHGDMPQGRRNRTIAALRHGEVRFLVATDLAARGIDVPGISHIINFDMPRATEDYVHRIGRTGRAGAKGTAISLLYPGERGALRRLESYLGHNITPITVPGFEIQMSQSGSRRPQSGGYRGNRDNNRGGGRNERRSFSGGSDNRPPARGGRDERRSFSNGPDNRQSAGAGSAGDERRSFGNGPDNRPPARGGRDEGRSFGNGPDNRQSAGAVGSGRDERRSFSNGPDSRPAVAAGGGRRDDRRSFGNRPDTRSQSAAGGGRFQDRRSNSRGAGPHARPQSRPQGAGMAN